MRTVPKSGQRGSRRAGRHRCRQAYCADLGSKDACTYDTGPNVLRPSIRLDDEVRSVLGGNDAPSGVRSVSIVNERGLRCLPTSAAASRAMMGQVRSSPCRECRHAYGMEQPEAHGPIGGLPDHIHGREAWQDHPTEPPAHYRRIGPP